MHWFFCILFNAWQFHNLIHKCGHLGEIKPIFIEFCGQVWWWMFWWRICWCNIICPSFPHVCLFTSFRNKMPDEEGSNRSLMLCHLKSILLTTTRHKRSCVNYLPTHRKEGSRVHARFMFTVPPERVKFKPRCIFKSAMFMS